MEAEIKCLKCGKRTTHFEIGPVFYQIDSESSRMKVLLPVFCPKCGADVSDRQFAMKENYVLMSIAAAQITRRKNQPPHLREVHALRSDEFEKAARRCKSTPVLVEQS